MESAGKLSDEKGAVGTAGGKPPLWLTHYDTEDGTLPPVHVTANSSNVEQASYNYLRESLLVRFKAGKSYLYLKVPYQIWKDFIGAESAGKYVRAQVANTYEYIPIDSADIDAYLMSRTTPQSANG